MSEPQQANARQSSAEQDGSPTTSSPVSPPPPLLLQFSPLPTQITPNFWHALTTLKLDTLRLSDDAVPITARYGIARRVPDRSRGGEVAVPGTLALDEESLAGAQQAGPSSSASKASSSSPLSVPVQGKLLNYNTAVQYTSADKNAIFNQAAEEILTDLIDSPRPLQAVTRFLLLTFADLKKYKYYHWAALPALVSKPNWYVESGGWHGLDSPTTGLPSFEELRTAVDKHAGERRGEVEAGFCLIKSTPNGVQTADVVHYNSFFTDIEPQQRTVLFVDPSANESAAGWPLRNLLALLSVRFDVSAVNVISWRDEVGDAALRSQSAPATSKSLFARVILERMHESQATPSSGILTHKDRQLPLATRADNTSSVAATGWERNASGKLAPKVSDLGPLMDPTRLANQAVDLNLKLMRWRIMPEIQLDKIASTRCLILGAGTLGCYVSRVLLGWGVRNVTLVDNGKVSFSNPVRQPLFDFDDCLEGGKPKAQCAADRLKKIYPGVNAKGVSLSIPMPGHALEPAVQKQVSQLEALYDEHDAVFLLMDSRESRWLPTLLGAAKGKLVINAALGFDTYLVMRHGSGVPTQPSSVSGTNDKAASPATFQSPARLGCYFCNDVVAPSDSLTDRTLDQMCTVTRPGLAAIAGASAVELFVSVLQHEKGASAPAPSPVKSSASKQTTATGDTNDQSASSSSCLGVLPHQIRGFLSSFGSSLITASSYNRCTACSEAVVDAYRAQGWEMLKSALDVEGAAYLEKLTGLDKMYEETERLLEGEGGVEEWSDDEEGEGEDV